MKQIIFILIIGFAVCSTIIAQTKELPCPTISVQSSDIAYPNQITIYKAKVGKEVENFSTQYVWKVEGGKVLAGQSTDTAAILREDRDRNETGNVILEIKGLPAYCVLLASESFPTIDPPYPNCLDKYGKLTEAQERERLDNLFTALQNDPTTKAVIKLQKNKDLPQRIKLLNSYLTAKQFDKNRVSFAVTSKNEQETEIWIVPAGAEMTDCKDCLIIIAKDYEQLEDLFRPKQ